MPEPDTVKQLKSQWESELRKISAGIHDSIPITALMNAYLADGSVCTVSER